jgi:hypothetical protein
VRRAGDRQSLQADLSALWFHDWMFRGDLALNSGIGFFSTKLTDSGDQGFWEA